MLNDPSRQHGSLSPTTTVPAPSPVPAIFIALAGALASVAIVRGHFDPDYFWHLATGRLILQTRSIPMTDPFSFTWFGEPWIPDQWLAQVVIAGGSSLVGDAAMLVLFAAAAALGPAAVLEACRRSGASLVTGLPLAILVTLVLLPQVTLRPQVLSFAFIGILLAILIRARPASFRGLLVLPVLMLAWANTHGFFILGLGTIGVYVIATLLGTTPMRSRRGAVAAIGAASLVAAAITPQGPDGIIYAISFLDTTDVGARQISEWQSPNFHRLQFLPFLLFLAAALLAGLKGLPAWLVLLAVGGITAGLFASRAIGAGTLLAMPAVVLTASPNVAWPRFRHGSVEPAEARADSRVRRRLELAVSLIAAALAIGAALIRGPVDVDPRRAPIEGTAMLAESDPATNVLADYGWGGYLINELSDHGGRVFVDGRMHKYAPHVVADYLQIVGAREGWRDLLDEYGVEAILLPPDSPLARTIRPEDGWCSALRSGREVLFLPCDPRSGA